MLPECEPHLWPFGTAEPLQAVPPILPLDISRCLGRRSMAPDADLCPRRDTCLRHTDMPRRAPGDPATTPVDLWVCSDDGRFAAWRRGAGTALPEAHDVA